MTDEPRVPTAAVLADDGSWIAPHELDGTDPPVSLSTQTLRLARDAACCGPARMAACTP